MANATIEVTAEDRDFASRLVADGQFSTPEEVLHAAMNALRREHEENRILEALAEEGEASGVYEGDVFAEIRSKYGWEKPAKS